MILTKFITAYIYLLKREKKAEEYLCWFLLMKAVIRDPQMAMASLPTLMAVCIYEKDVRAITNDIYKLKNRIYAKQDEIKSTNLIKKQTIEKNRTKNKEYAEQFVKTVSDYNITTFCIIMKRPTSLPSTEETKLPKQYHLLMKKIEYCCERRNTEKAIFVFDETNEREDLKTAENFNNFLFKCSTDCRYICRHSTSIL